MTGEDWTGRADLRWLTPEQGGRQAPPPGPTYSTVAKFDAQGDEWMNEAWSVVVTFITQPNPEGRHDVGIRFLVPEAPEELLSPGSRFWVMEGARTVAEGIVTNSRNALGFTTGC
jgi:hypothetical protein